MSRQDRLIAEEKMRRRDRQQGRIPAAFIDDGISIFNF
jgi:hypothetical protein